jgi:hypothetical protein
MVADKPIEGVMLGGQTASWVDGHSLIWEPDGVTYTFCLTLDEAIRLAESLD